MARNGGGGDRVERVDAVSTDHRTHRLPGTRRARRALVAAALLAALGCHGPTSEPTPTSTPAVDAARTFAEVPVRALQSDPAAHAGEVFEERFVFFRVWWGADRTRPNQLTTDLPTHFEARIAAAPLYAARIEFPSADDALVEQWREGTELCLRVRFLRLHETSRSPVFSLVGVARGCGKAVPRTRAPVSAPDGAT